MKKLILGILFISNYIQFAKAQGWISLSDHNSLYTVSANLSPHSIKVGVGTNFPTAQFHTTGSVKLEGLENDSTLHNFVVIDANGQLFKRNIPLFLLFQNQLDDLKGRIIIQNAKIELLETQIAELKQMILEQNNRVEKNKLFQNIPNPYNQTTEIAYEIEESINNAKIFIYNLQGEQLKEFTISKLGKGKITLESNNLNPGMYLYSLVLNGKIVDTKRLVLTK